MVQIMLMGLDMFLWQACGKRGCDVHLVLVIQCCVIAVVSLIGGIVPMRFGASHRLMQLALSFVAGVMFGIAILDLLPEAIHARSVTEGGDAAHHVALWVVIGFLAIFLLERFVCFHHHDLPEVSETGESFCSRHDHAVSWIATGLGLSLHSLAAGVALAAAVMYDSLSQQVIPGLALLLAIVLHKPFDSLSLIALMTAAGHSARSRIIVNILFALVTPLGVFIGVMLGIGPGEFAPVWMTPALGFAVGMFLCVALCDLLPELQFHRHDRVSLTVALLLGLGVAWFATQFHDHDHEHAMPTSPEAVHVHEHDQGHDHHDHHDHDHDDHH